MFRIISIACLVCVVAQTGLIAAASTAKPTCGGTSSSKATQLVAPAIPPRDCVYHFKAYSSYVCQLRITFSMKLAPPSIPNAENQLSKVECVDDYFEVNGLRFCGIETNQHIYIPFNRSAGVKELDMHVLLAARTGWTDLPTPSWDMFVTQLECPAGAAIRGLVEPYASSINDGYFVAPPGCLQYFPNDEGYFTSFNYHDGHGLYTGGLNYAICFRRTESTRALHLQSLFFKLGAEEHANSLNLDNSCYPQVRGTGHNEDFLMIPQATIGENGLHATYFCGTSAQLLSIKSEHPGPLMVIFNSDSVYKESEAGFAFAYTIE